MAPEFDIKLRTQGQNMDMVNNAGYLKRSYRPKLPSISATIKAMESNAHKIECFAAKSLKDSYTVSNISRLMSVMQWWLELLQLISLPPSLSHTGAVEPRAAAAAAAQLSPASAAARAAYFPSCWQDKLAALIVPGNKHRCP